MITQEFACYHVGPCAQSRCILLACSILIGKGEDSATHRLQEQSAMHPPSEINHPSYGLCFLEPTLVAIQWASPHTIAPIQAVLTYFSLLPVETVQDWQADKCGVAACQFPLSNPSMPLTWTTAEPMLIKDLFINQKQLGAIEWVAPVYRARLAEKYGHTLFAINPSILFLTEEAYARLDGQAIPDGLRIVQPESMADFNGSVVLQLPNNDATEIANRLTNLPQLSDFPHPVGFEAIPYIEPTPATVCAQAESIWVCGEVKRIEQEVAQLQQLLLQGLIGESEIKSEALR